MLTFIPIFPLKIIMLKTTTQTHAAFHAIELDSGMLAIPLFTDTHLMELHIKENQVAFGYHRDIENQESLTQILQVLLNVNFDAVVFDPDRPGRNAPFVATIPDLLQDLGSPATE